MINRVVCPCRMLVFLLVLLPIVSVAMPTEAEIEAANPVIKELTADDFAALRAGKLTRQELSEKLLGYVGDAETEAGKLVLYREAFRQCVAGGDCKKAVEVFGAFRDDVKDVPGGLLAEWSGPSVPGLVKKGKSGPLCDLLEGAISFGDGESCAALTKQIKPSTYRLKKTQEGARLVAALSRIAEMESQQKDIRDLKSQVRKSPDDPALHEKLGFALAAVNDWKGALKEFAQGGGKIAEIAVWENKYPETGLSELTTATVADFWWGWPETAKAAADVERACHAHAAGWYRVAIDNGSLTGLKRTLAEKRIKEAEAQGAVAEVGASTAATGKPIKFKMSKDVEMELMPCPAGSFKMGYDGSSWPSHKRHTVIFTRPFWMAKFPTTVEQWNCVLGDFYMNNAESIFGTRRLAVGRLRKEKMIEFCETMTKKYRKFLPRGYVFRLPTEAEWEYACKANSTDPADPYVQLVFTDRDKALSVAVKNQEKQTYLKSKGVADPGKRIWDLLWPVGLKKPNAWGLYDMIGLHNEVVLDTYPRFDGSNERKGPNEAKNIAYADNEKDPLSYAEADAIGMMRGVFHDGPMATGAVKRWCGGDWGVAVIGFRIVAGPDLLKEKRQKRK